MTLSLAEKSVTFPYPWTDLEKYLAHKQLGGFQLLVYGSMMNQISAAATLGTAAKASVRPAIGFGFRRVFNYRMGPSGLKRHGAPASPEHVAALNIISTQVASDTVNGLLLWVPTQSIPDVRQRELDYNLLPIEVADWVTRVSMSEPTFILVRPQSDEGVLPHLNYLKTCEVGAANISQEFLSYFRQSTFLADNRRLSNWNPDC